MAFRLSALKTTAEHVSLRIWLRTAWIIVANLTDARMILPALVVALNIQGC